MSVYTSVSDAALQELLSQYQIGNAISLAGIQAGIENSNYFLSTTTGEYVLTVFETLAAEEIPFCMRLMHYLVQQGVPCASPLCTNSGGYVSEAVGKPVSIVHRLKGKSIKDVSSTHIQSLGIALGRWHMHTEVDTGSSNFNDQRSNRYDKKWRHEAADSVISMLSLQDKELLQAELGLQRLYTFENLPQGVIHSDLFRDNALFDGSRLTGIIDLYDACTGALLYDIAVIINDWCRNEEGELNGELTQQFLCSYQKQRRLNSLERGAWPILLRAAALRFWLSRLVLENRPKMAKLQTKKEADPYKIILQNCILEESLLMDLWVN